MKMEDKIISFETAKLAKEKGFNIRTQKVFVETLEHTIEMGRGGDCTFPYQAPRVLASGNFDEWDIVHCNAPTQSLLQKYLREVHNIHLYVWVKHGDSFKIVLINNKQNPYFFNEEYKSYEEALEVGLQEGLRLIKQK